MVHRLGHEQVPEPVVVPVDHAQPGIDQTRPRIDDVLPEIAVDIRAIEVEPDRVGDVAERRRRIVDARTLDEIQARNDPLAGSGLDHTHLEGRVDHRPLPGRAGSAQLQMDLRERPVARRLEEKREDLPRGPLHRRPRRGVHTQRLEKLVAPVDAEIVRHVSADHQAWVVNRETVVRCRKPAQKIG